MCADDQVGSDLVRRARDYARAVHAGDVRKSSDQSYFDGHLHPVAELVREHGGDRLQIAAAYLHDTAEDHGGERRLVDIAAAFGPDGDRLAQMVRDLSDSLVDTEAGESKADWRTRKERYLEHLDEVPDHTLVVAVADKLQNAASIVDDHAELGDELWRRFTTGKGADQAWYYRTIADAFERRIPDHPLVARLRTVVDRFPVVA